MENRPNIKDFFMSRIFSRKLIVWITATVLLCFKIIDPNTWLILSGTYMGLNTMLAAIDVMKSTKEKLGNSSSSSSTTTTSTQTTSADNSAVEGEA